MEHFLIFISVSHKECSNRVDTKHSSFKIHREFRSNLSSCFFSILFEREKVHISAFAGVLFIIISNAPIHKSPNAETWPECVICFRCITHYMFINYITLIHTE